MVWRRERWAERSRPPALAMWNMQSAICNPQSAICKLFCGQSEQSRPSDRHMHNAVTIRTLACAVSAPFPLGLGEEWDLLT
jgi:hypothetical protein